MANSYSYMTAPNVKQQSRTGQQTQQAQTQQSRVAQQGTPTGSIATISAMPNNSGSAAVGNSFNKAANALAGGSLPPSSQASTTTGTNTNWNLPSFNPTPPQQIQYNPPSSVQRGEGVQNFFDTTKPWNKDVSLEHFNQINNLLPVAQFDQNNYQWANEFNQAAAQWAAQFGLQQNQTQFQQQLATQQQLAAEQQAALAAAQWQLQFGHTSQLDWAGLDLQNQQINNQFTMGMDQNQATRDVANTYADSNRYQADQQLAGQLGSANIYAGAQRYGADQQLAGQLGSADIYAGAQRYGADQQFAGTRYETDAQKWMAQIQNQFLYSQLAQQAQQAQLERENAIRMANIAAYGRSQSPQAAWARSWA